MDLIPRALQLLLDKDMIGFAGLWAEDGVAEFPFAPPGWPARLEGRAAVEDYVRDYPKMLDIQGFPKQVVHRSTDPDVLIAEFDAEGVVVATGKPYRASYIVVITTRDGEIAHYRDYWNPLLAQELA
ncbi:Ketosteroid isomerase-related protein [Lentzea albidocapillata subsp. violacea]|uniref:Ketosteroid isomerase-related protein n=1 Tax=Lentzea albidocapillata subsp. violacea TaxID=128104 RepID=A0A1G9IUJ8_9PSEU|nr:nuclear transport factor 2 family protein [Lentzea albidocapillata]SDL28968.1 Ketosteroid isomerase-related protein [Lentzea albidocapillata subsp. violacea]